MHRQRHCSGFAIFKMFMSPVSTSPKNLRIQQKTHILSLKGVIFFADFCSRFPTLAFSYFRSTTSKNLVFFSKFWLDGPLFLLVSQLKPPRRRPVSLFLPPSWIRMNLQNQSRQRPYVHVFCQPVVSEHLNIGTVSYQLCILKSWVSKTLIWVTASISSNKDEMQHLTLRFDLETGQINWLIDILSYLIIANCKELRLRLVASPFISSFSPNAGYTYMHVHRKLANAHPRKSVCKYEKK